MSFALFEQLPNILKKLYMKKLGSLISYENNERTNFSSTQARLEVFWFIIYMPWGTLTMSFVWFEQLPNILKKAIYEKIKFDYFVRKPREDEFFFYAS